MCSRETNKSHDYGAELWRRRNNENYMLAVFAESSNCDLEDYDTKPYEAADVQKLVNEFVVTVDDELFFKEFLFKHK